LHDDWRLVEEDEGWFSRFAQPTAHAWAQPGQELRLVEREARQGEPKALACYGAVRHDTDQVHLSFCDGQPDSQHTLVFVPALLNIARREGKRVVVILWDNASWHNSKMVRHWIHAYNQQAKRNGDVRLIVFRLPTKSPWLMPMEPRWIHAKRQVCEPVHDLNASDLQRRLCCRFETEPLAC
jgi:hypothetical protein